MNMDFRSKSSGICWTTTPFSEAALAEMPYVEMQGWEQTWSSAIENIHFWMQRFLDATDGGSGGNPFEGLYLGKIASNYVLPYFNEYHHAISQSWGASQGPVGSKMQLVQQYVETVAKTMLPAAGILFPQSYEGASPGEYSFNFNLINTNAGVGNETGANIVKNKKFLESFIKDNLHNMNGCLSITPPLIYEVYIPGIRWSPAAIVSSLTVNNKGSMNKNTNGMIAGARKEYIYPDAWEVTVGIKELINETKDIYDDAVTKGSISGMTTNVFP